MQNTGTRASVKRTPNRAVEEAKEDTPQNVSFDTPFEIGERVLSVKMNFFIEKDGNALNRKETVFGDGAHYWSDEDTKMAWMRKTRIRTYMQMELEACLDDIDWMVRCHNCEAFICPQEKNSP